MLRLPMHIAKVMRMKDAKAKNTNYLEGAFSHNFGNFFFYANCTIIWVYGFSQVPHILPVIVLPRLAFIEIMWWLMWIEKYLVRIEKKG